MRCQALLDAVRNGRPEPSDCHPERSEGSERLGGMPSRGAAAGRHVRTLHRKAVAIKTLRKGEAQIAIV